MGEIFAAWDLVNRQTKGRKVLALDSNILIQLCDDTHMFHQPTLRFFQSHLRKTGSLRFVYFLASKLELKEYMRKRLYTNWLRAEFKKSLSLLGGNGGFDRACLAMDKITKQGDDRILSDKEIKVLREGCFYNYGNVQQGIDAWKNLSRIAIKGGLSKADAMLSDFEVSYAPLHDKEVFPDGTAAPQWANQEKFIYEFGLSSSDAAILNMAQTSEAIHGVVTNDSDMVEIIRASGLFPNLKCYTFITRFLSQAA